MTFIDKLVSQITSQSGDESKLKALAETLVKEENNLDRHKAHIVAALGALDPAQHSLGYLYLLDAKASTTQSDAEILQLAVRFLEVCSSLQIRAAPQKFVSLTGKVKEQYISLNLPKAAIAPLQAAVQKLVHSPQLITPIHAQLFQVCLLAKCYNAALPALSEEVSDVDPSKTAMTARDFQLYCYYGARIHIGRKRYGEALQLLLHAISAPSMVVNAITLAAYKTFILVGLIHTGKVPGLPKFTPSSVTRAAKAECTAYNELAQAYTKPNSNLDTIITTHQAVFTADGYQGLVKLAVEARTKRSIQRLTQTYLTLSTQHIAEAVGLASPAEAEMHILRMIDAGDIFAEIDGSEGMVRFLEDPEHYDSPELMARLDNQIQKSMHLAGKLQAANHLVSCDKALVSKTSAKEVPRFDDAMEQEQMSVMGL